MSENLTRNRNDVMNFIATDPRLIFARAFHRRIRLAPSQGLSNLSISRDFGSHGTDDYVHH
jgi:hypothetical protein